MTTKTVRAGRTLIENGTNAASDIVDLQGGPIGGAGATVIITSSASNAGTIQIAGGAGSNDRSQVGGQGALLDVVGVLTNSGAIVVGAGTAGIFGNATSSGKGGQLLVSGTLSVEATGSVTLQGDAGYGIIPNGGVLTNTGELDNGGLITMNGSGGFVGFFYGYGSVLDNSGSLSNTGTILVQGGGYSSGHGATLNDSGVMTNSGLITLSGGSAAGIYRGLGSGGGTLAVSGMLTNTGSIVMGGGATGYGYYGQGYGGTLLDSGVVNNRGVIDIQGGGATQNMGVNGTGAQLVDTGRLFNQGTIRVDGSAATDYQANSGGTLSVSGYLGGYGRILITGGGGASTNGPDVLANYYAGSGGVLIDSGGINTGLYGGGSVIVGGGQASTLQNYDGGSGGTLSITGTGDFTNPYAGGGPVTIEGGAGAKVAGKGAAGGGGVLDVAGRFEQGGALILQAGGAGKNGHVSGGGATMILSGTLDPSGSMTIEGGGAAGAAASASLTITATGKIEGQFGKGVDLENAGRIVLQAGAFLDGSIYGSRLGNSGVISGSGTIARTSIVNTGTIDAGIGQLLLKGDTITSGAATGQLTVGLGGTLTVSGGTIDARQSAVLAGPSATLAVTAGNAGVLVTSALGGALDITGGGTAVLNAADTALSVLLSSATNLTLSRMGAIAAMGSSGADTITALASGQTLTGGLGVDLLTGAAATGDVFRDVAAGLNGDTIAGFAGNDMIDITDLAPGAALALAYTQHGATGSLTLSDGSLSTTITLQGQFTQSSFVTASDLHGGVQITLHG